ncbi:MAG TPA: PadR family transcriptional regulator [Candidatus Omnitrophota bacterium]|nr:PadR family transcriptional regulator [Candidatus Omnitrophota bacterium]
MKLEQELLILGLLKDKPRHGYEIKKQVKEVVSTFAVLDVESIYYTLNLLEKKGFVKKAVSSDGQRPEKFVYSLTQKGDQRFRQLLTKIILNVDRPNFSVDIALYFLPYLPLDIARHRLKGRARLLSKVEEGLKNLSNQLKEKSSYHLKSIVEHNLELLQAEKKFIQNVSQELENQKISIPEWPHAS